MKCAIILVTVVAVGHCLFMGENLSSADDVLRDILSVSSSELRTRSIEKRKNYENTVNFIFLVADRDRNRKLSVSELAEITTPKNGNTKMQQARLTVQLVDTDRDGEVSKAEMLTFLKNNAKR